MMQVNWTKSIAHRSKCFLLCCILLICFQPSCNSFKQHKPFNFGCYSENNGKIYYHKTNHENVLLKGANPENFAILSDKTQCYTCLNQDVWASDSMNVYYKDKYLKGVDIHSFRVLNLGFSKDKNQVFFHEICINSADAQSFKTLSDYFAKDKNKIFCKQIELKGISDVANFEIIDGYLVRDKQNIYQILPTGISIVLKDSTHKFKAMENGDFAYGKYYSSTRKVFFLDFNDHSFSEIKRANPIDFQVLSQDYFAKDNNLVFYKNNILYNANPSEIKLLGNQYAKDKNYVFFKNKKIVCSLPDSFRTDFKNINFDATDTKQFFLKGKKTHLY